MNYFDPEFISGMLDKYSHMNEAELFEEVKRIKQASGKSDITDEDRKRLLQYVQPILSQEEIAQLEKLLKAFE